MDLTVAAAIVAGGVLIASLFIGIPLKRIGDALQEANRQRAMTTAADLEEVVDDVLGKARKNVQDEVEGLATQVHGDVTGLAALLGAERIIISGKEEWQLTGGSAGRFEGSTAVVAASDRLLDPHGPSGTPPPVTRYENTTAINLAQTPQAGATFQPTPFRLNGRTCHEWALDQHDRQALWRYMLEYFMREFSVPEDARPWHASEYTGYTWYEVFRGWVLQTHGLELLQGLEDQFPPLANHSNAEYDKWVEAGRPPYPPSRTP